MTKPNKSGMLQVCGTYSYHCALKDLKILYIGSDNHITELIDSSMAEAVSRQAVTREARLRSQVSPNENCGGQSGTGSGLSTSVFPCQYHSTNAPYPFIHLPPTLCNISLPVLQFSPVSSIPPMFHTHSFTYHPHYIMFLSQYFSFPPSVSFHQCSIPIQSPTTHAI